MRGSIQTSAARRHPPIEGQAKDRSDVFAGRGNVTSWEERFAFAETRWLEHAMGPPVLDGAVASVICCTKDWLESGSRSFIVGTVEAVIQDGASNAPLVYAHGAYHGLALQR